MSTPTPHKRVAQHRLILSILVLSILALAVATAEADIIGVSRPANSDDWTMSNYTDTVSVGTGALKTGDLEIYPSNGVGSAWNKKFRIPMKTEDLEIDEEIKVFEHLKWNKNPSPTAPGYNITDWHEEIISVTFEPQTYVPTDDNGATINASTDLFEWRSTIGGNTPHISGYGSHINGTISADKKKIDFLFANRPLTPDDPRPGVTINKALTWKGPLLRRSGEDTFIVITVKEYFTGSRVPEPATISLLGLGGLVLLGLGGRQRKR